MTIRILGFSLTGNTRKVWDTVAQGLGAEVHQITALDAPMRGPRLWTLLRLGYRILTKRRGRIAVPDVDWSDSDVLILAAPVWAGQVAKPMLQWLNQNPGLPDKVALIVTSGSPDRPKEMITAFGQATGQRPIAVLHLGEARVKAGAIDAEAQVFCDHIHAALASQPQMAKAS